MAEQSARLVIALLSGDDARDAPLRAALAHLPAESILTSDPDRATAAGEEGDVALWILDTANPGVSAEQLTASLPAGRTLLLVDSGESLEADASTASPLLLSRPFQERTLLILCEHLLREATIERAATAPESPSLTARPPALFKTRALYAEATRFVEDVLESVRDGKKPSMTSARVLAEKVHTSLLQGNRLLLMALEPYERFELPAHCVNVALLAAKVSMGLGWGVDGVLRAIQAGLLHDMGMARLPESLLHKEGKLNEEEWELVRRHPSYGAEIVERFGEEYDWLRLAVFQEHERMNGQGYPSGLTGEEIDALARVIAVADVFEAFSHPRTYRSLFTSYEALEKVVGLREESLSAEVVAALVDEISAFPLDSFVLLSTGDIGRVVATNPTNLMRPVIRTVWDPLWRPVEVSRTLDLSEETSVSVTRPLHETEIPIT